MRSIWITKMEVMRALCFSDLKHRNLETLTQVEMGAIQFDIVSPISNRKPPFDTSSRSVRKGPPHLHKNSEHNGWPKTEYWLQAPIQT